MKKYTVVCSCSITYYKVGRKEAVNKIIHILLFKNCLSDFVVIFVAMTSKLLMETRSLQIMIVMNMLSVGPCFL